MTSIPTAPPPRSPRTFRLAVRELAAFCWQRGDLFRDDGLAADAQEGIAGHRKVRDRRPAGYREEVTVRLGHAGPGWTLAVSGRIDGLYVDPVAGDLTVIEEIKTLHGDPAGLPESVRDLHRVQARLYAALLARREGHAQLGVEVTWFDLDSEREHRTRETLDAAALAAFLDATLARIGPWLDAIAAHRDARDAALAALPFPHTHYRPGQRALVAATFRALRDRVPLVAEAPTGIGKTVSTLYPALKGFPEDLHDRVVYLTATNEGRRMPERVLADLAGGAAADDSGRKIPLFALSLTARDRTCFVEKGCVNGRCGDAPCPYTTGFHDRLDAARHAALATGALERNGLRAIGERYTVCPWALGRELAPWADILVLDLNQAFDPGARLAFLLDDAPARTSLLVDEAHHLADRVRAMYSESLDLDALREIGRVQKGTALAKAALRLARQGTRMQKACAGDEAIEGAYATAVDTTLTDALDAFVDAAAATIADTAADPAFTDLFFRALHARALIERWNERFALLVAAHGTPRRLEFLCLDAAPLLAPAWKAVRGVALFSGTLRPLAETRDRAGLPENTTLLALPSPFPPENLAVFTCPQVDTRFAARDASLPEIARLVEALVTSRPGRFLIAFPSYRYLQDALAVLRERLPAACHVVVQEPGMDTAARDAFLAPFRDDATPWVAGFGIAGGLFAEGVDFPGEALVGVMVVGTGLPAISAERELMRRRIADDPRSGWMHAYQLPGLARVLQTAGRLIRSETDRGVLVLVDRRYAHEDIRALLPERWQPQPVRTAATLAGALQAFWSTPCMPPPRPSDG